MIKTNLQSSMPTVPSATTQTLEYAWTCKNNMM